MAVPGIAGLARARLGDAWLGRARHGMDGGSDGRTAGSTPAGSTQGTARRGYAGRGAPWLGTARQGRRADGIPRWFESPALTLGGARYGSAGPGVVGWPWRGDAGMGRQWHTPRFESWGRTHGAGLGVAWRGPGPARQCMAREWGVAGRHRGSSPRHSRMAGLRTARRGLAGHGSARKWATGSHRGSRPRRPRSAPQGGAWPGPVRPGLARKAEEWTTPGFKSLASTTVSAPRHPESRDTTPAQHQRRKNKQWKSRWSAPPRC